MRLSHSDLEDALDFLEEAGTLDGTDPMTPELLAHLAALVRCQGVSYAESDRVHRQVTFFACNTGELPAEGDGEAYQATVHEHPIRRYRSLTGELGALKIYDFVTARQLRRTAFYCDYLCRTSVGVASGFLMTLSLPAPRGHTRTLLLDRESADFGERERTLLNLLQPHLANLRRATEARRRARATIQELPNGALSERETEVLLRLAEGMRNREIAQALWIAPGTVHKHLNNIYAKLGVHTRAAAAARLRQGGKPS